VTCAPSFFPGDWDAIVVPASHFFSDPALRHTVNFVVYGPAHLFRVAWLAGALDYLKEPWQPEELFLRLRGPRPPFLEWPWMGRMFRLEGILLSLEGGPVAKLTPTEAELLRILVQRRGTAVSREILGWAASCSQGRVVDTLMVRLRHKIQTLTGVESDPIPGVRGLGYRLP